MVAILFGQFAEIIINYTISCNVHSDNTFRGSSDFFFHALFLVTAVILDGPF